MVYDILINKKAGFDTEAVFLSRELELRSPGMRGVIESVSTLLRITGANADHMEMLVGELASDGTVEVSLTESLEHGGDDEIVLSFRNGTVCPVSDAAYRILMLRFPRITSALRIKEYTVFTLKRSLEVLSRSDIEAALIATGRYRRVAKEELLPLVEKKEGTPKVSSKRVLKSIAPRENPELSEPFSTVSTRMVMNVYANRTYEDMKSVSSLKAPSGEITVYLDAEYSALDEELRKIDLVMDRDDANAAQTYFLSESREPTEMELRIIARCRSERWAHPAVNTSVRVPVYNDPNADEAIKMFKEDCRTHGWSSDKATFSELVFAPIELLYEKNDGGAGGAVSPIRLEGEHNALRIATDRGDKILIFDHESNNSKTSVDPSGGATSCLGTVLRRALRMRATPYETVRLSGIASPYVTETEVETARAAAEQGILARSSLDSFSGYARTVGVPCSANFEYVSDRFASKHMEVSAVLSVADGAETDKKLSEGDAILIFGSRTGRDGRVYRKHLNVTSGNIAKELSEKSQAHDSEATGDGIIAPTLKAEVEDGVTENADGSIDVSAELLQSEENAETDSESIGTVLPNEGKAEDAREAQRDSEAMLSRADIVAMEGFIIDNGEELCGEAISSGNALMQKKLMRICADEVFANTVKRIREVDPTGLVAAVAAVASEMSDVGRGSAELGAEVYLDCVPVKYNGMLASEVAFSETCERMVAVVDRNDVTAIIEKCAEYGVICTRIGAVTRDGQISVYGGGKRIAHLPVDLIMKRGVERTKMAKVPVPDKLPESEHLKLALRPIEDATAFQRLFVKPTADHFAAFESIAKNGRIETEARMRRFDCTASESTGITHMSRLFAPTAVSYIRDGNGILTRDGERLCSAVSIGMHTGICDVDPYRGAYYAMTDALCRLIASGAPRRDCYLALQLFQPTYSDNEEQTGETVAAVAGAYHAQKLLEAPIICGDFSFSGGEGKKHKPAVAVFGISVAKEKEFHASGFRVAGSRLALFKPELGKNGLPTASSQLEVLDKVERLFRENKALSAFSLTGMSLAEGVMRACVGAEGEFGFEFDSDCTPEEMYGDLCGAIAVELSADAELPRGLLYGTVLDRPEIVAKHKSAVKVAEKTVDPSVSEPTEAEDGHAVVDNGEISISLGYLKELIGERAFSVYEKEPLSEARGNVEFPRRVASLSPKDAPKYELSGAASRRTDGMARILIPRFNGSIGVESLIRAFNMAAGSRVIIEELPCDISSESANELAKQILRSGAVCFSDFAEAPTLLAALMRYPAVASALARLRKGGGLIYGCGTAFAALIQAGYIGDTAECGRITDITVGENPLSGLTRMPSLVKVYSVRSPFTALAEHEGIYRTEISSYRGRLSGNSDLLAAASAEGIVATVYADGKGLVNGHSVFDPCESALGIDSMTSADGSVFGQLSFPDRADYMAGREFDSYPVLPVFPSIIKYLTE